jgi:hypothetical protein
MQCKGQIIEIAPGFNVFISSFQNRAPFPSRLNHGMVAGKSQFM